MKLPPSERTREGERQYQLAKEEGTLIGLLDEPALIDYKHWKLIHNRFPYDEYWCASMLLVLKRECQWQDMTEEEIMELHELKVTFKQAFDRIVENGWAMASIPHIPHVHLLKGWKK